MVSISDYNPLFAPQIKDGEKDPLFDEAVKILMEYDHASASLLQRRLSIGYARAARLIDQLEFESLLSSGDKSKPREVLYRTVEEWEKGRLSPKRESKNEEEELEIPQEYPLPNIDILSEPKNIPFGMPLSKIMNRKDFRDKKDLLLLPLGINEKEELIFDSLDNLGHLLVAGIPDSDKLVFADTFLTSLIMRQLPLNVKIVLADYTRYLDFYNGLPHLLCPVIHDFEKSISAMKWTLAEVERRQKLCSQIGVRSIEDYNKHSGFIALPRILIMIYEVHQFFRFEIKEMTYLFDQVVSYGKAMGVHLVLIANRLALFDIPMSLKSNMTNRLIFRTANAVDSSLAEVKGAENLKQGEAIFRTLDNPKGEKLKIIYTSEENVKEAVSTIIKTVVSFKS